MLLMTVLLAALSDPAFAGRFLATGHDADLHCADQNEQCHFFEVAVKYVRGGAMNPSLPVLILDRLDLDAERALDRAFPPAGSVPRVVIDPRSPAFTSFPIDPMTFSAVIIASDVNCGGCDLNESSSTPDSDAINIRAAAFHAFFNGGGGILALAGANHGDGSAADDVYYDFLPIPVGGLPVTNPFTLTPEGLILGFVDGGVGPLSDINCCPTHNSFTLPAPGSAIKVAELDSVGRAETIFAEGTIVDGEIVPSCLKTIRETLLCTTDGSGDYLWTFLFRNLSKTPVEHLFFVDLPPGVSIVEAGSSQPNYVHFTPPIPPSGFRNIKLRIKKATPGTLSFKITLHDKDLEQCCVVEHTLELPECECAQIVSVKGPNCFFSPLPPYSYTLTLENLSSTLVDYLLFTPTGNSVPNVTVTPNVVSGLGLAPVPYSSGQGSHSQTVTISGPDAKAGQKVCLNVSLHDQLFQECCSIEQCVTLPSCVPPLDERWDPIGTGTVAFFRDRVVISNLGSSGEDGARVHLGEAESFRLGWRDFDRASALPQGSLLRFGSTGSVAGREQELGAIEIVKGASALELSADFSAIDSPTQRLEVYAGEELVTVVSGHQGTVRLAGNNGVVIWPAAVSKLGGDGGTTCYAPEWNELIRITIPGTGTFVGDELRVLAETDETLDFISSFRLQAAQIPKIVVVEAEAVYDCNDNGVPDTFDVANGTSFDANFDGIPDECQASTNDLVVLLNTGFDEAAGTVLLPPALDADWTVVNADTPRSARIVANPVATWAPAQPDSAWISVNRNRGLSVPGLERPEFETCFCLGNGASGAVLDLELFADDRATVFLNGEPVAGPGGGFNTPEPFSVHYSETVGEGLLRPGENCLQVEVDDFGGSFTGLDLVGTLRVANGVCE